MLLKTSAAALRTNGNLWPVRCGAGPPPTRSQSFPYHRPLPSSVPSRPKPLQQRNYATHHVDTGLGENRLPWPSSAHPTPYEIFGWRKDAPYRKQRYYELVKLYHPDRSHHTPYQGISRAVTLERYRLVVAANDILGDSTKRRAYDLLGTGWPERRWTHEAYREADRSWRQKPGNAANNATWEDWERWHKARDSEKQEPTFMSNGGFVGVISLFVLVGAWGQTTRAGNRSLSLMDLRDLENDKIGSDMRRRRAETGPLSRDDRIENFLRQREGWAYNVENTYNQGSAQK